MIKRHSMVSRGITTVAMAAALGVAGFIAAPSTAHAASHNTFTSSQKAGLTGYFSSNKAGYAFHWKYLQSDKGIQRVLVFGDFKKPNVFVAVPTKLATQSKDKRTLKYTFKLANTKGKLSATNYNFYIKKQSTNQYTIKLKSYSKGKLPSTSGTAYRVTRTTKSPASWLANIYTKSALQKEYTKQVNANVDKQYQDDLKAGKNVANPKTDAATQAKIKQVVDDAAVKGVKQFIKNFNYNV